MHVCADIVFRAGLGEVWTETHTEEDLINTRMRRTPPSVDLLCLFVAGTFVACERCVKVLWHPQSSKKAFLLN